ncbi:hypothetical protein ACFQ9X_42610 [Catenulispora yoronensis]
MPMIEQARDGAGLEAWLWRLNYARAPHHLDPLPTVFQMSTSPTSAGHKAAWRVVTPWNPGVVSFVTMDGPFR